MASFNNEYSDSLVTGTNGNDYIWNSGNNVTIEGGKGSDTIGNQKFGNTETHRNYGENVTISGGDGNDDIYGEADLMDGGEGSDTIYNGSLKATIIGGAGDDSISLKDDWVSWRISSEPERLIKYSAGDGNDTIIGLRAMDTVEIAASNYSSVRSGNDIIVKVGDGSITLVDGMNRSVYIETVEPAHDLTTEGDDSINNTIDGAIINALGGKDTITNSGENVSINGGAGNDLVNNNAAQNVTINTAEGNDTIKLGSEVKSFKVENFGAGDVISLATAVDSLETVSGGIKAGNVTISGITSVAKTTNSWQIYSNFISRVSSTSAGAKVSGKKITYDTTSSSSTLFTITGLSSTIGVSLSGTTVTLTEAALANRTSDTITISDGYTLALATGVDTIKEELAGGWTTLSSGNVAYLAGGTGSYYSLSGGNKITYNASVAGGDNMVELRGVKGTPILSGKRVSLAADNFASDVSVISNAGEYVFYLKDDLQGKKFTGSDGMDAIGNAGDNVTINGGAGDDTISNSGSSVNINGGEGKDSIRNYRNSVTINTGEGDDTVYNGGDSVTINTGAGNDTVENHYGHYATINTGDGADSVYNLSSSVTIDTGAGNDSVYNNYGNSVTINTGAGDDIVSLGSSASLNVIQYAQGDGNDKIYGFKANSTLSISGGEFSSVKSGDNIIVTVDDGKISLMGAASLSTVNIVGTVKKSFTLSEGNDTFCNTLDDATIEALGGNDSIYNRGGKRVSISGGNGNDTIYNTSAPRQSGSPFNDDDTILDRDYVSSSSSSSNSTDTVSDEDYSPDKATLLGGAGKDVIYNVGANVLIEGGTGNDEISLSSDAKNNLIQYSAGDGNDTIWGFRADSTLSIANGSYSSETSGDNIIVTVSDSKITLVDAAKLSKVNIKGTKKEERLMVENTTENSVVSGTAYADVVINEADYVTVNGGDGNDKLTSEDTSNVTLNGDAGNDTLKAFDSTKILLNGGEGNDSILSGSGNESATIIGGAGNDKITIKKSSTNNLIKYESGDGNDLITGFKSTDTLQIGDGKATYSTIDGGADVILKVGDGQITIKGAASWLKFDNDKSPANIAGELSGKTLTVTVKNVTLSSVYENADASKRTATTKIVGNANDNSIVGGSGKDMLYGGDSVTSSDDTLDGGAGADKLYGRLGDDSLFGGSGNDTLYGGDGEDTLWGGSGNDSLIGGADNDLFIYSGGKDVIKDYVSGEDVISLGGAVSKSTISGNNVVLTIGSGTLTIRDAKYKEISFISATGEDYTTMYGGLTLDNAANSSYTTANDIELVDATARTTAIKITGNELNNTILGSSGKNTISGMDGADSIIGGKSYDTLNGGEGNDYLAGGAGNDKLYGDDDDDTLWGGTGNDTLTGGAGNDLFIYSGGKDVIADYVSGEDVISLGGAISKSAASGSDVTLTVNKSTLTLKNARGKEITFVDAEGNESTEIFGKTIVKTAEYDAKDDEIYLDGSARTKATKITGNELNNTIFGGSGADTLYGEDGDDSLLGGAGADKLYGGDDDDTLWGGKGNDTLYGGAGSDTFIYNPGDGKDVICDFYEDDMLQISGTFKGTYNDSSDSLILTVNGLSSNKITIRECTNSTTFNINGDTYEVKGSGLVKTDK